ncbi:lysozyme C, milk isozyme [Balearica regulorum gibbericeps]|uniref:lysozyme C, milk isozyme n=1 Tax=Balearica regulorum gibbericeps TaxID=100784 RepID=UPI003F5F8EC5
MGSPVMLLLLALLSAVTKAKVFGRCDLAHVLQEEGLDGYGGYSLANWLCMAFYVSTFNTAAQSIKADGSADYGIFQISSQLWCTDDRSPSDNGCRVACRDLLSSNITDDIICAKRIVRNPQGMNAWEGWAMHCKGRDLSEWVEGCEL